MADKSIILNLKGQVQKLIADHAKIVDLCSELASQRDLLKSANLDLSDNIKQLNKELSQMRLMQGFAGDNNDMQKARARVNHLMREVDKCIALVNKKI